MFLKLYIYGNELKLKHESGEENEENIMKSNMSDKKSEVSLEEKKNPFHQKMPRQPY